MIEPHGGTLVDSTVNDDRQWLEAQISGSPRIHLTWGEYQELVNIAVGRYSPVDGFLSQNDFLKVVNDMTLEDGTVWPLPITLSISSEKASELEPATEVGLHHPNGHLVGMIEVKDVYRYNKKQAAKELFGTVERSHPGVSDFLNQSDFNVGGKVTLVEDPHYTDRDLLPAETRVLFEHRGWNTVVGFQTRNAPHRAHEYIQKSALELVDGLLIQPKLGKKKQGDYSDKAILGAYDELITHYYPRDHVALSVFPSPMRYAGPREAVFDALIRKNQGCTHFIIGRDHAGVGDYYGEFESQQIFQRLTDIGITPLFYDYSFYCEKCDGMASEKICPHGDDERIYPSGTEIRSFIQKNAELSPKMMRSEVVESIAGLEEPFINNGSE